MAEFDPKKTLQRPAVSAAMNIGSSPWRGVDPIFIAAQMMMAIQAIPSRQLDITKGPAVITIGTIQGGVRNKYWIDAAPARSTIVPGASSQQQIPFTSSSKGVRLTLRRHGAASIQYS